MLRRIFLQLAGLRRTYWQRVSLAQLARDTFSIAQALDRALSEESTARVRERFDVERDVLRWINRLGWGIVSRVFRYTWALKWPIMLGALGTLVYLPIARLRLLLKAATAAEDVGEGVQHIGTGVERVGTALVLEALSKQAVSAADKNALVQDLSALIKQNKLADVIRRQMLQEYKDDKAVGSFIDPRTKQRVAVFAKRGEAAAAAMKRVRARHGA